MKDVKISELNIINTLATKIWNECYKDILSQEQRDYMLDLFFSLENLNKSVDDKYIFKFITIDDKIVGFISYKIYEEFIYLSKLYILKDYRKYHLGSKCIDYLKSLNKDIRLNVNKYNSVGINFYLKNSFIIECSQINDIGNNYIMDDYVMLYKHIE